MARVINKILEHVQFQLQGDYFRIYQHDLRIELRPEEREALRKFLNEMAEEER